MKTAVGTGAKSVSALDMIGSDGRINSGMKMYELLHYLKAFSQDPDFLKDISLEYLGEEILRGPRERTRVVRALYRMHMNPNRSLAWERLTKQLVRLFGPLWQDKEWDGSPRLNVRVEELCCRRYSCLDFSYGGGQCDWCFGASP